MRWKRGLALLLSLCILIALMGCGSKPPATTPDNNQPPANNGSSGNDAPPPAEEDLATLIARGKQIEGMTYEYFMKMGDELELTGKVWFTQTKIKQEMDWDDTKFYQIIDLEKNTMLTYSPSDNTAIVMQFDDLGADVAPSPFDFTDNELIAGGKFIASETIGNMNTTVWTTTDEEGDEVTIWIHQDYGIPVRIQITSPEGDEMIIQFNNIQTGKIADTEFEIPAGVEIIDPFNR
jgi:outer membrane lipoprotein-sorting protein